MPPMLKIFQKSALVIAVIALLAGGATLAVDAEGGTTTGLNDASQTQYDHGGQGCTPGYWKNNSAGWVTYKPTDNFDAVFGITKYGSLTLQEALEFKGNSTGYEALARHAAAALLNTANSNINYLYSNAEVIKLVQEAVANNDPDTAHGLLATQNELTCSIDAHGNPIPPKK